MIAAVAGTFSCCDILLNSDLLPVGVLNLEPYTLDAWFHEPAEEPWKLYRCCRSDAGSCVGLSVMNSW